MAISGVNQLPGSAEPLQGNPTDFAQAPELSCRQTNSTTGIYEQPSIDSPSRGLLPAAQTVQLELLGTGTGWARITQPAIGWIEARYLTPAAPCDGLSDASSDSNGSANSDASSDPNSNAARNANSDASGNATSDTSRNANALPQAPSVADAAPRPVGDRQARLTTNSRVQPPGLPQPSDPQARLSGDRSNRRPEPDVLPEPDLPQPNSQPTSQPDLQPNSQPSLPANSQRPDGPARSTGPTRPTELAESVSITCDVLPTDGLVVRSEPAATEATYIDTIPQGTYRFQFTRKTQSERSADGLQRWVYIIAPVEGWIPLGSVGRDFTLGGDECG